MRKIFFSIVSLTLSLACFAQNQEDVLRYSQTTFGGTARYSGMAGAFGALGGDISSLSVNPAGLGIYRKNEFTITPSLFKQNTNSVYNNTSSSDFKYNFNLGNVGLVGSYKIARNDTIGWQYVNFGFGYNRTNNFYNRIEIQGDNHTSSLLNAFLNNANGHSSSELDGFNEGLAFQTYLLDTIKGNASMYQSAIPNGGTHQSKILNTKGSMGETVFSFGANYSNKLYLGATIGFPSIKYTQVSDYNEVDLKDTIPGFQSFKFHQELTTSGTGINFKLGAIYRAADWLRLGAAIHTPSFYSLQDNYKSTMYANYDVVNNPNNPYDAKSPDGSFNYTLITPLRAMVGLAFIIQKQGLISLDFEHVNYAEGRLRSATDNFQDANNFIKSNFLPGNNIRIGTEWRIDPFSIRAGFAGDALTSDLKTTRSYYTIGLGYRQESYFVDFAYVLSQYTEQHYLYDPSLVNPVTNKMTTSSFMLTLGYRY